MRSKITWKILGAYIVLIIIALIFLNLFVNAKIQTYYKEEVTASLMNSAMLVGAILREDLADKETELIKEKARSLARQLETRITVIAPDGKVLSDSEEDAGSMTSHLNRDEVIAARANGTGKSIRYSDTLGYSMQYVAYTVNANGKYAGIVRLAMPLKEIENELSKINRVFMLGGFLAIIVTLMIGYFISRNISLPIRKMEEAAHSIAHGDFSKRVDVRTRDELGELGGSLNRMADELQIKINNLEKMDKIRKDFVANVSHELKTPLTAIKGFIETLEDGAIKDQKTAKKFLAIIAKHVERLSNIINDLLSLTETEVTPIKKETTEVDIKNLLDEVIWSFSHALSHKKQKINANYDGSNFLLKADKNKVEQVMVNLIDNAIKYTPEEGEIKVSLFEQKDNIMVTVEDNGIGIPREHLDRIFERFYRVDKARSRESGGTGLGLSIVKHAVLFHGGHIDIESELGKGTKITVVFPRG